MSSNVVRFTFLIFGLLRAITAQTSSLDSVDLLFGTRSAGRTLGQHAGLTPSVCEPFGAVHWSPMTRVSEFGRVCFDIDDTHLLGLTGTRQMAIWMGEWGQFSFLPSVGEGIPPCDFSSRRLQLKKESCRYTPYEGRVVAGGVTTEWTGSSHAAIYRITFPAGQSPRIVVDASRDFVHAADWLKKAFDLVPADGGVSVGSDGRSLSAWNTDIQDRGRSPRLPNFRVHLKMEFSEPFVACGTFVGGERRCADGYRKTVVAAGSKVCAGDRSGAYVTFEPSAKGPKTILVRLGVSLIDDAQAEANLRTAIDGWDYAAVRDRLKAKWEKRLSSVSVSTARPEVRKLFYTALYRTMLHPRNIGEGGRHYSAFDDRVHEGGDAYTGFSLWDTYRAAHPLMTLVSPDKVDGMMQSLLNAYREGGWLPKYPNPGYTGVMVGSPAEIVLAEAVAKGFTGFDRKLAYESVKHNATVPAANDLAVDWDSGEKWTGHPEARAGLTRYQTIGYVACDETCESVSRTQDFGMDDFAAATLAEAVGERTDAAWFRDRMHSWTNLWHAGKKQMLPRNVRGEWVPVGDAKSPYTEMSAEQAIWCVPHDVDLACRLLGGPAEMERRLDRFYARDFTMRWDGLTVHNNEPSHHVPYYYNVIGRPDKCARTVRHILENCYWDTPVYEEGNDDCGQLSAWYVLSALGFYPLNPPDCTYEIGSPIVDAAEIRFGPPLRSTTFHIRTVNQSKENVYVKSVKLNGRELSPRRLRHADILAGGELVFEMSPTGDADMTFARRKGVRGWNVFVDGRELPLQTCRAKVLGDYQFGSFEVKGGEKVVVTTPNGNVESWTAEKPFRRIFDPDHRKSVLLLFGDKPETDTPDRNDPKVRWFGPGEHYAGGIELTDGETLYLSRGAVVHGSVYAHGKDITVAGPGTLTGVDWEKCKGPYTFFTYFNCCTNLVIRGVTLTEPYHWTLAVQQSRKVLIDGVRLCCGNILNDDGIDLMNSSEVTIRDAFVRTQDDAIAIKGMDPRPREQRAPCEDILVENSTLWVDHANVFRIGYESNASCFRRITVRNVEVHAYSPMCLPFTHQWAHAVVWLQPSNGLKISDVLFDGLRVRSDGTDMPLVIAEPRVTETFFTGTGANPYDGQAKFEKYTTGGSVDGVVFRNCSVEGRRGVFKGAVYLNGRSGREAVRNVRFVGCARFGEPISAQSSDVHVGRFAEAEFEEVDER